MSDWKSRVARYDEIVAEIPEIVRKGKTVPYTSANGYMYSLINKEGQFGVRLSKESQAQFIADHDSGEFMSHGAVMKDYVLVPDAVLGDTRKMARLLRESHAFVNTLPPK